MKTRSKKGDVWVSAILYFGLGMVILTIMLTLGTPVINRLRDKNIVLQTKELMHSLDDNIREVAKEGPGSQRPVTVEVRKGEFHIDPQSDKIYWNYTGSILLAELGQSIKEGNVNQTVVKASQKGMYQTELELSYAGLLDLVFDKPSNTVTGRVDLVVRNRGIADDGRRIKIEIIER